MRRLLLLALVVRAVAATAQTPPPEVTEVVTADISPQDRYGNSVDLVGDLLIVGAPRGGEFSQGHAYVFEREDDTWTERAGLYENGLVAGQGGTVRILPGPDGGIAGALALSGGSGIGLIWEEASGVWGLRHTVDPAFGPIATAVGLARDETGADYAAFSGGDSLKVARRASGAEVWVDDGCLGDPGGLAGGQAALWTGADGAPRVAVKRRDRAEVEVRRRDGGTGEACGGDWVLEGVLTPSVLRPTESFAFDVEADAALRVPRTAATAGTPDRVAVAAWESVNGGPNGAAFVYTLGDDGTWTKTQRFLPEAPVRDFGREIGLSGETLAVMSTRTHLFRLDVGPAEMYRYEQVPLVGTVGRSPGFAFSGRTVMMGDRLWDVMGLPDAGSAWAFVLPPVVVGAEDAPEAEPSRLSVSPNPARARVRLEAELRAAGVVEAVVVDVLGRVVWRSSEVSSAPFRVDLDVSGWAPGVYVARVVAGGAISSVRVSVVR